MSPLAGLDDLAARLQPQVLVTQTAMNALAEASGLIRQVARQEFTFVSQETIVLAGGERVLSLPQRPLVVDSGANPLTVTELGLFGGVDVPMIENRDFIRLGNELTRGYPWWWTTKLMGWPFRRPLGVWTPQVLVTYSHGYDVIPDDIVSLTLDVAQTLYTNPMMLRQVTVGGYSETYAAEILGKTTVAGLKAQLSGTGRRRGSFSI